MKIAVPKEIKNHEYRVALTPTGARELVARGHSVTVQAGAGVGAGFSDADYEAAGARLEADLATLWGDAELILKVKEPQPEEVARLTRGQTLFTYLHLAAEEKLTRGLMESGATCIAYETVTDRQGGLPLLAPMSTVAGRMAVQAGAHSLEKAQGGSGVLLPGVPGVAPGKVAVIGGGVVGENAARMALGLGAEVTVLDKSIPRLEVLDDRYQGRMKTVFSTADAIDEAVRESDLIVGAVLIPGAAAPKLITRAMLADMKPGSVLVDVAIDQGGCFETSRATTHAEPTYLVDGIVHYCVANMPGAVARTSTQALTNATMPFVIALADKGWKRALADDAHFLPGLNVHDGQVTYRAVAEAFGLESVDPARLVS
ncbi:alanine dehydrogenase [Halomonas sp. MCCC 1A17488]|uniref:alanine dehydrogenase n=1 Tax=unclassified Halomonas TaxID=2609666 RepID=UPI0018D22136|nr:MULTISPECIES: alanine dehydrogenase [unclassified Halomonas]MCE8016765.1 alanine dehydrogenase [Halomonas sp. MCCC 1A17488]MCG3240098.1 alanine dehydrogenase [Halomonas sp. MCCC 1A17488]QPP50021.1 alanine dehydrogenase [Halomonas sp. SS10-MC5]